MSRREADNSGVRGPAITTSDLNVSDAVFLLAFGLFVLISMIENTTFDVVFGSLISRFVDICQVIVLMLLLAKFFSQSFSVSSLIIIALSVIVGFVSWRHAQEAWLFWISLFVACSQNIKLKKVSKLLFVVVAVVMSVTVLCALAGIIENLVTTRAGTIRYALGFKHPNFLGIYLLLLCVSFAFCRDEKSQIPSFIMISLVLLLNTAVSDSRTSTLLLLLFALMIVVYRFVRRDGTRRILSWLMLVIVLGLVLMSYWLMVAFDSDNAVYATINSLLSDRIRLANGYFEMKPLTLFGGTYDGFSPIYWADGEAESFVVDNAYCHLLLRFGIVPTAVLLLGLFILLFKLVRKGAWNGLFFGLTLMFVCGLTETFGVRIDFNFFLLELGDYLLFPGGTHFSGLIEIPRIRNIGLKPLRIPNNGVFRRLVATD